MCKLEVTAPPAGAARQPCQSPKPERAIVPAVFFANPAGFAMGWATFQLESGPSGDRKFFMCGGRERISEIFHKLFLRRG